MPLRLNLHHEIDKLHAQRKRDPLKISLFILAAIIAGFAALYAAALGNFTKVDRQFRTMKTEFDAAEPAAKKAVEREASIQKTVAVGTGLVQRIETRFQWSLVLEQLANLVPREVQITKLDGHVQGPGIKKVDINLDGIAAGPDPRKVAEDLRLSLVENLGKKYKNVTAAFRQLEEGQDHARFDGKEWPTATFGIVIQLQAGDEQVATPVPRTGRRRGGT